MTLQKYPIPISQKGIVSDLPSATDKLAWDDVVNFLIRKGRLQSRPRLNVIGAPPDGRPVRAMYTFQDIVANWHTLILTSQTPYFITQSPGLTYNALTMPMTLPNLRNGPNPFALREINQQVYFSNGVLPLLYVDGSAKVQVAGDVPGSPLYLTENASHLIGINWIEPSPGTTGSQSFPFRVRWSDVGDPTEWISAPTNTAGALDLIESGGILTGAATLGRNTYITRRNGATVLFPTGNAQNPFQDEPFMWSETGWGNFYPYSLVTWAYMCICVTRNAEVLMFDGSNFTRLAGGKVKKALNNDLSMVANDQVFAFPLDSWGPGFDFEGYGLVIPGPNIVWLHNLEEGNWVRMNSLRGWFTAAARVAIV